MATRNYHIDIELYKAVASPPRPSLNDQAASDAYLRQLLVSKQIQDDKIMSYKTTALGNTMLHVALLKGNHLAVMSILNRVKGPIWETNEKLETALHIAARNGCMQVVEALLGRIENDTRLSRALNLRGNTAAHEALINGHHATVKRLVEYDPEISTFLNHERKSLFYIAVEQKTEQAVKLVKDMLEKADVSKLNEGKPLLYPAIKGRNREMIDCILNKAPNIMHYKDDKGRTALHYAASIGYFRCVANFINRDSSCVMARDADGAFAVHHAARNGHIKILERLLDKRHSPDLEELVTNRGRSILHEAANHGKDDMVKHILDIPSLPSFINMQDADGNTPLHLATIRSKSNTASILTWDANVNLKIANGDGKTVLDVAQDEINKHPYNLRTQITLWIIRSGIIASQPWNDVDSEEEQREDPHLSDSRNMNVYKDRANTLTLVATLIATVTFAAGFTVPGGYDPNSGISLLLHKKMFAVFIICNSCALYCSIMAVVSLLLAQIGDSDMVRPMLTSAHPMLVFALLMMMLAFMAGSYVTISKLTWLGILALGFGGGFIVAAFTLLSPLSLLLLLLTYASVQIQRAAPFMGVNFVTVLHFPKAGTQSLERRRLNVQQNRLPH